MNTKVFGQALSVIGGIISAIWGIRYFLFHRYFQETGFDRIDRYAYSSRYFTDMNAFEVAQKESASLTVFLIGLGLLAFGLLLVYFSNSDSNNNTPKEEDKNS